MRNEARWLRDQLARIPAGDLSPLLSVGSGNDASRSRQPWIDEEVFAPLRARGIRVVHHEHADALGVDVAGDLTEAAFVGTLPGLGARSILFANVLEHIADPGPVATAVAAAVPPGGRLLVTVPRRYPYHPDPLDTMLRPTVDELAQLFASLQLVAGEEVACEPLLAYAVAVRGKSAMVANGLRAVFRGRGPYGSVHHRPQNAGGLWRYAVGRTSVTCAVFIGGNPGSTAIRPV